MATDKLGLLSRGLSTNEIDSILKNNVVTKKYYIGTFPSCVIPETGRRIYFFITNTHVHNEPGEHWNCWFVNGRKVTFFDSFGRDLRDMDFPPHYLDIVKNYAFVDYTTIRVQDWFAKTCGYYCLHFSFLLSLGLHFSSFLSDYSLDYKMNDVNVMNIVNSIF